MPVKKTKKKNTIKMSSLPVDIRAKAYMKDNSKLLEKYFLKARFVITNGKKPGIIIKLALWALRRNKYFVDIEFSSRLK